MSITLLLVIITVGISLYAFSDRKVFDQLKFNAVDIWHNREYHRMISNVFLHADLAHLMFNMLALYSFGNIIERQFSVTYGQYGSTVYILFYFLAAAFANSYNLVKHRDDSFYNSVGASGAVSAILFAFVLFYPNSRDIQIYFIPIPLPAWILGALYLVLSTVFAQRGGSRIDHMAHFMGAIFGFFFPMIGHAYIVEHFVKSILP
ncbi:MAG: rhomboid family intramembrane serine protease [Chitinophagales bacterium]